MMPLAIAVFLIACLVLLTVGLAFSSGRGIPQASSKRDATQSERFSLANDLELPSPKLAAGISNSRDLEFITRTAPAWRRTLVNDRARLTRSWLRENRRHLRQLLRLHRLIARTSEDLSVGVEFRVAATYVALQLMLFFAEALVLVAGPFRARNLGLATMSAFDRLSAIIAATASTLDASKRADIRANWARIS